MTKKLYKKIIAITKELLKNTDNIYYEEDLKFFLEDFIEFKENVDRQDLLSIITKIALDGFDLHGFEIYEIPIPTVYSFYNQNKKQMFDACLNNGNVEISYLDNENSQRKADCIKQAIERYNKIFIK